jgi:lysophospholipase L1-like esterase
MAKTLHINKGIFLLMVSLALLVFASGCSKEEPFYRAPVVPVDTTLRAKTYLALGDSYTIGQSVSEEQRFPYHTVRQLIDKNVEMSQAEIVAATGWSTGNLLGALNANPPTKTYDFVTLLIGVNNQYQGRSPSEYRAQFTELLGRAISYAGNRRTRVFVLSIPDYSVTPFARGLDTARISREIDEFNAINKEVSLQTGVAYFDITPISRQARTDQSLTAGDGLHPSGKQYEKWALLLSPAMKAAL